MHQQMVLAVMCYLLTRALGGSNSLQHGTPSTIANMFSAASTLLLSGYSMLTAHLCCTLSSQLVAGFLSTQQHGIGLF
jgi:hypothetical protein